MKFALAFAAVVAVASAQFIGFSTPQPKYAPRPPTPVVTRVVSNNENANALRNEFDINPDGSYIQDLEIDNGISAKVQGTPRDFGGNPPIVPVVATGAFGWTSPEGQPIAISYTADENGYQPAGDAIPTPHPIPEAILRALEFISKNQKI